VDLPPRARLQAARGPSRKALFGKSCAGNKGLMVRQMAKNLVSGRASSGVWGRGGRGPRVSGSPPQSGRRVSGAGGWGFGVRGPKSEVRKLGGSGLGVRSSGLGAWGWVTPSAVPMHRDTPVAAATEGCKSSVLSIETRKSKFESRNSVRNPRVSSFGTSLNADSWLLTSDS
jgi:hypothetical protein